MATDTSFDHLPDEVILEILLRLPVKSLLQFKSVCKYWCTLIESPIFITKHFNHHKDHTLLFVHHYDPHTGQSATSFLSDEYLEGRSPYYQDFTHESTSKSVKLGPLNGLFFLYDDLGRLAIWNPTVREVKPVALSEPILSASFHLYSQEFGFGINPLTNDYKVVRICNYWDVVAEAWHTPAVISVYTLSTDSWRHFEDFTFPSRFVMKSSCNTYMNGFYFWRTENSKIFAFDLDKELFQEVPTPDSFNSKRGDLGMYNDSIAMFFYNLLDINKFFDIWIMEGIGSWTQKITIGPLEFIRRPLGYWKNGEVLLETIGTNFRDSISGNMLYNLIDLSVFMHWISILTLLELKRSTMYYPNFIL